MNKAFDVDRIDTNDIIGREVGQLVVIAYQGRVYDLVKHSSSEKKYSKLRRRHYYLCKCDCGNYSVVQRGSLLNDNTKSCGCRKKNWRKRKREAEY